MIKYQNETTVRNRCFSTKSGFLAALHSAAKQGIHQANQEMEQGALSRWFAAQQGIFHAKPTAAA